NLEDVLDAARFRGVPSRRVFAGESFEAAGLHFEVLGPRRDPYPRAARNNGSVVLRTRLGARRALFTGDAEKLAEGELLSAGGALAADLLKVGHHGSRTSSAEAFLAAVNPRLAFLGAGATNRFGHPAPEVLERFAARGVRVLRTDLHGDFAIEIEGRRVRPLFAPHPTEGFAR
ncbi:MAG: MBL fold metallo-hydrolase, partial [Acidobacteria bacterium]|nr:MBL fold metallo-hydrolase [Acidobacteriota bacterium]